MYFFTNQKPAHRSQNQTYSYQEGEGQGGGINWEIEIGIQTLIYVKMLHIKDLLYSTGNSI